MGPIRRTISLALALALMVAGFGSLAHLLLVAPVGNGWMILGSGFLGILGASWIYEDFINATPNDAGDL
jgi:hypothetical protein